MTEAMTEVMTYPKMEPFVAHSGPKMEPFVAEPTFVSHFGSYVHEFREPNIPLGVVCAHVRQKVSMCT